MPRLPLLVGLGVLITTTLVSAVSPLKAPNGIYERSINCHAITGAEIIPAPGERIEDGTIVMRDGVITAIGQDVDIPAEA